MLSLIPIFIYLIIIKLLDNFSLVKWRMLIQCGLAGILVCAALALTSAMTTAIPDGCYPLIEETGKGAIILYLIRRHKILFFAEALCYGAAVGAGFALCENLIYAFYNAGMTDIAFAFRGFGTALLHMGCTALLAVCALNFNRYLAVIPGILIHYIYNMFLLQEFVQLLLMVILFLTMFVVISLYDERRIFRWMDTSITDDIKLLVAIHEGRLTDTPAGKYLLKIKTHFPAEVFFDMICYVQLYLDMLIKGKSRMLLVQADLAEALSPEEKELDRSMKQELSTLRKNIGPIGIQILRPILRYDMEDLKILE